jgi:hypothetical protein
MKIGNDEISKLAENYADFWADKNDKQYWMKLRSAYRAGFFAALKILKTAQPSEAEKSVEQTCFKHAVINQRELLLAFCNHLNEYPGLEDARFDFMMQDFIDKSQ